MAKATKPATPAKAESGEFVCIVDRINFDDGRLLLRDQTIALNGEEAANYLAAEMLARV